jgi:hypothetical protein
VHSYDHNVLKSSDTSPNFLITLASLKSPVAGSPARLNATAPPWPSLREKRLSAHYNGHRVEAFSRFASRNAVIGGDERQRTGAPPMAAKSAGTVMAATAI